MTDAQLLQIWRKEERLALPYFDGQGVELFFEDEDELLLFADSIRRFLTLGPSARLADTRHVYAFFKDVTDEVGFEWAEDGMEALSAGLEDIWRFIYPTTLGAFDSWDVGTKERTRQFIVLEGELRLRSRTRHPALVARRHRVGESLRL